MVQQHPEGHNSSSSHLSHGEMVVESSQLVTDACKVQRLHGIQWHPRVFWLLLVYVVKYTGQQQPPELTVKLVALEMSGKKDDDVQECQIPKGGPGGGGHNVPPLR